MSCGAGLTRARRGLGPWAATLAALMLFACASERSPQPAPPPPAPPPRVRAPQTVPAPVPRVPATPDASPAPLQPILGFAQLPGWDAEDHAAALDMFRSSCGLQKDAAWHEVCQRARDFGAQDEVLSKAFWETNFRIQPLAAEGLLTGYFSPEYPARPAREFPFTAPVRARPADLPAADVGAGGGTVPYRTRAAIEDSAPERVLAWMRPEDLFFLQIQGSGVLDFPDGRKQRAVYAANNGFPFVGIAAPMRAQVLLSDSNTSGEMIRAWLAQHRGPDADEVMRKNPRYIFFNLQGYDGREPSGAAGVVLTPGRSLAVDPSQHDYGAIYWINGEAPALSGAFPAYRRLAMALDTGSAIRGEVRADLYLGTGEDAGAEAGRVRHRLKMYRLIPVLELGP